MLLIPYSILAIENDNDREFIERIFVSYQRLMYHEIFEIVGDSWLTEDILQTTIVSLINHISTLRELSSKKLVNYIISASKNTAISQVRRSSRSRETFVDDWWDMAQEANTKENPEFFILHREEMNCLAKIWVELDERSKYLLSGRYILHKSYTELGKELNIKPESVRMAVSRAKRLVYNLLKAQYSI